MFEKFRPTIDHLKSSYIFCVTQLVSSKDELNHLHAIDWMDEWSEVYWDKSKRVGAVKNTFKYYVTKEEIGVVSPVEEMEGLCNLIFEYWCGSVNRQCLCVSVSEKWKIKVSTDGRREGTRSHATLGRNLPMRLERLTEFRLCSEDVWMVLKSDPTASRGGGARCIMAASVPLRECEWCRDSFESSKRALPSSSRMR